MDSFRKAVRATTVRDADRLLEIAPCTVSPTASLIDLATIVTERPNARVLSVVDARGRLIGLIRARVLFEDLFFQVMPEEFLADATGVDRIVAFARLAGARTAKDVMQPPVSVTMDNTVRDAFERMHDNTLAGLPIVDSDRKVVGYLDMLEMLLVLLRSYEGRTVPGDIDPSDETDDTPPVGKSTK